MPLDDDDGNCGTVCLHACVCACQCLSLKISIRGERERECQTAAAAGDDARVRDERRTVHWLWQEREREEDRRKDFRTLFLALSPLDSLPPSSCSDALK